MKRLLLLAGVVSISTFAQARATVSCPSENLSQSQIVALQGRLFDAMSREDRTTWNSLTEPDFIAFERGKQYDGGGFFALISSAHKAGYKFVWSVTEPRVEGDCNLVVMAYVNVGSIGDKTGVAKPTRWLETVAFRKDGPAWRAFLVTSMRVTEAKP